MAKNFPLPVEATDAPIYDTDLDAFEVFWAKHKGRVILGAIALVAVLVVVASWFAIARSARLAGEAAFANAKTAEELQEVIDNRGGSVVAGNAAILLAQMQRDGGKLDEANATLRSFVESQPDHPFAPVARLALAENLAVAGNAKDAEGALQSVVDLDSASFAAPVAMLFKSELLLAGEDRNEALKTFQRLANQYPKSVAAQMAEPVYQELEAMARPAEPKAAASKDAASKDAASKDAVAPTGAVAPAVGANAGE